MVKPEGGIITSPDDIRLASAHGQWILAFHSITDGTSKMVLETRDNPISLAMFSPDGLVFASVTTDIIHIWEISTGQLLKESPKHDTAITFMVFSPDSTKIAFSSSTHHSIWSVKDNSFVHFDSKVDDIISAAFFPNGARLVTRSVRGFQIWDTTSSTPTLEETLPDYKIFNDLQVGGQPLSSDATRMVTGRHIWDLIDLINYRKLVLLDSQAIVAIFTSDNRRVVYTSGRYIHLYCTRQ